MLFRLDHLIPITISGSAAVPGGPPATSDSATLITILSLIIFPLESLLNKINTELKSNNITTSYQIIDE